MQKTQAVFTHTVSKGGRFKQIYIPRHAEHHFDAGDLIEVRLLKKKTQLYYSPHLKKLSPFKERLIFELFSFLSKYKRIQQVFIFGSFLTKKTDYRDIDILLITEKDENIEESIHPALSNEFNLKFHVISFPAAILQKLLLIDPLTRSMLSYFVSNKKFTMPLQQETEIDEKHLLFVLMMPEDILKVELPGKVYYNNVRKLLVVEAFLNRKEIDPEEINEKLMAMGFDSLKKSEALQGKEIESAKKLIRLKLKAIHKKLKWEKTKKLKS